jgi:peptidoglycan hydrolase-like protein with peptidoglycan-binding domain
MASRCPFAAWRPVPHHGGAMVANHGLILHVQEGNGGLQGWFSNPASGASSTFWVGKAGQLEQYTDSDVVAWAQSAGNGTYCSVESEGYASESLTGAQLEALSRLYAWGHATHGWPNALAERPGERGLGWHGMGGAAWGGHLGCPGESRKRSRSAILAVAFGGSPPPQGPAPAPPPEPSSPTAGPDHGVCDVTVPQLARGSVGPSVRALQVLLGGLQPDGDFGPLTEGRVRQYQAGAGLGVDGIVGAHTWGSLLGVPQ